MGVHGLTTYLREKQRTLSRTLILSAASPEPVPIVVDGWSFIYDVYEHSNLPWVYGGEYGPFAQMVKTIVQSWIRVGLQVYFVFDGPTPELKFPTIVSRLTQSQVQHAQLFFRTSSISRSTGRFLNESRILPPLAYSACVQTLEALRSQTEALDIHYADEEGDPYAVELAGRLGGYVLGQDSDFVIFNSEGYRGYIPLEDMIWQADAPVPVVEDNDDDFQTVVKPKARKKATQNTSKPQGLLPPDNVNELVLSIVSYSPETLAEHLGIPITLLPLLAALVGNDFSKDIESSSRRIQTLFFERHITLSQRIERVASTIHNIISPLKRKASPQVGGVMDLIQQTVGSLLIRHVGTLGSGEVESIVDKMANAALQYTIPRYEGGVAGRAGLWATGICALHGPEECSIVPMMSRTVMQQIDSADPSLLKARELYLKSYRSGQLSPRVMDILNTATSWPRLFLENPDLETVGRSVGQPIRLWLYAILDDVLGIEVVEDTAVSESSQTVDNSVDGSENSDEDELIDVRESDSDDDDAIDFLAPLKGELARLQVSNPDDNMTSPLPSVASRRVVPALRPSIQEYLRRGTRISYESIPVKLLSDLLSSVSLQEFAVGNLPLALRTEEDRFTVLLRILRSDIPEVRALSQSTILPVLSLRWVLTSLHLRWEEAERKDREKERWTRTEAKCYLSSFDWNMGQTTQSPHTQATHPPIEDHNVQLVAQMLVIMESIEQLSQCLLLTERVESNFDRFSGETFHGYLTKTVTTSRHIPDGLWEAATIDMADTFQEERARPLRKAKTAKAPLVATAKAKNSSNKAFFALLGDQSTL